MEVNKKDYYSLSEIVVMAKALSSYTFKRWWIIMFGLLAGAGTGILYYYLQKPKYEAITTFILEEKSPAGGGLAGLASQFGFNLGSLAGGGSIFSGDNILDILKSRRIVKQVLLSSENSTGGKDKTLADLYLSFSDLNDKWKANPRLSKIRFDTGKDLSPLQDSALNVIYERILKKNLFVDRYNKKGSIIKVQVTASNELFARIMTERLVNEAADLYLDIRIGTSQENIRQLQRRSDSLLMLLNRKSFAAAAIQPIDLNPGLRTAAVPTEIATRDKTVLATLYAEVTKNLEASKLLLSQQTPVIQLLDQPGEGLDDNKKSLILLILVCAFIAAFLCIILIAIAYFIQ